MCDLLADILRVAVWKGQDDFPYDSLAQSEPEKWLSYMKKKGWVDSYFPRLTKMNINKRDEALAEICGAFFLEEKKGFVIKEREPEGANNKRGEFILSISEVDIFCEVKSPGWESEIVKKEGVSSPRLQQGKYLSVEGRWGDDSESIRQVINKAYEKLPDDKVSLLIIVDDFWRSLFHQLTMEITLNKALYYKSRSYPCQDPPSGCFVSDNLRNLSGVLFIKIKKENNQFVYQNKLCINSFATVTFPHEFKDKLDVFKADSRSCF